MASVVVYGPPVAGAGGVLAGLLWLGLFAAFVGLIAWAVIGMVTHEHRAEAGAALAVSPAYGEDDALAAARARYAGGEIDREQYFQVVEDLTGVPRPGGTGYAPPAAEAPAETSSDGGSPTGGSAGSEGL